MIERASSERVVARRARAGTPLAKGGTGPRPLRAGNLVRDFVLDEEGDLDVEVLDIFFEVVKLSDIADDLLPEGLDLQFDLIVAVGIVEQMHVASDRIDRDVVSDEELAVAAPLPLRPDDGLETAECAGSVLEVSREPGLRLPREGTSEKTLEMDDGRTLGPDSFLPVLEERAP